MLSAIILLIKEGDSSKFDLILNGYDEMPNSSVEKVEASFAFAELLVEMKNDARFEQGIDALIRYRDNIRLLSKEEVRDLMNDRLFKPIAQYKEREGLKVQAAYVNSKLKK